MMESEAWGFDTPTPKFINQAIEVECAMQPEQLLSVTQSIERELGRERGEEAKSKEASGEKYCSRRIDIDIIFYGEQSYMSEKLTIPHPLMQEREFVLRPIAQITPEWRSVTLGRSCRELLDDLIKL